MMRITIVVGAIDNSGGFRVVATLGNLLIFRGHSVCVITERPPKQSIKQQLKARLKGHAVNTELNQHIYLGALPAVSVSHAGPLTPQDIPDADVVIGTWWQTMELIEDLPVEKGLKVHLVQDYEVWARSDVARVDRVLQLKYPKIAISKYLYDLLVNKFENRQVYLVPNAIDHSVFFAEERTKRDITTVGFTYSHDSRKGSDLILKAVAKARQQFPALKVLAFGHTRPQASIPVPDWVDYHVAPSLNDIRSFYASCDAWLFGSRREGFGLPILEAMACRTPVIGMPAGAAPDLISGGAGVLVPEQDWQAMANAILDLTMMPTAEWVEMSRRAHHRAAENQWETIGDKLEHILNSLLDRHQINLNHISQ